MSRSIYVIRSEPGPTKIGIAGNVRSRLGTLRTSSPYPLAIAYAGEASHDVAALESRVHAILADRCTSGEWFDVTPSEAIETVLRAAAELGINLAELDFAPISKKGRPALGEEFSIRLQMVIAPSQVAAIDAWRKKQDDLPSRSEAIRRLIEAGLGIAVHQAEASTQ